MKILICDDNFDFCKRLELFLAENLSPNIQFYTCQSREQLIKLLFAKNRFDLLLMDICLEQDNGIQLSKIILEQLPQTSVIFITGYPDLFYETVYLSVRPCGFLKKPVDKELLLSLIRQVIQERKKSANNWIYLKTRDGMRKVHISEIHYIESCKHTLIFHNYNEILESYGRLGDLSHVLPDYFFHCHKSFLVNARYIRNYNGTHFLLDDGTLIGISQTRRKTIRQKFFQYLDQQAAINFKQ